FGHVDIKLSCVQPLCSAVGGLPDGLRRLYRFNIDTIYRADFCAEVAYDTVIDLNIQLVTTHLGYRQCLVRVLYGIGTVHLFKVIIITSRQNTPVFMRGKKVP